MKTTTTTTMALPVQHPGDKGQPSVSASLLFPYLTNGHLSFKDWEYSLRRMAANPCFVSLGCRLLTDSNNALHLNPQFATFHAIQASNRPQGAIACVILHEGLKAAKSGNITATTTTLALHSDICLIPQLVKARALHSFLAPQVVFEEWFATLKQQFKLEYGRDIVRVGDERGFSPKIYWKNTGQGEMYFDTEVAKKVIMDDFSERGILVSRYLHFSAPR